MSNTLEHDEDKIEEYEYLLHPYWAAAYEKNPGKPGLPMRLVQYMETREKAEDELAKTTGRHPPPGCKNGFFDFLLRYESGGLPIRMKK